MNTWIKFCGLCRPEDFAYAVELGVNAAGVVCVPNTPRFLDLEELRALSRLPRGNTKFVLVFQDASAEFVKVCIDIAEPDVLQFHGTESAFFCLTFGIPYIKATRDGRHITALLDHTQARAILIDIPELMRPIQSLQIKNPIVLAGQLSPANVLSVINRHKPFGVDVSRGIELEPRKKDHLLMTQFVSAVRGMTEK
ncbi:phosphoribosylanthranilate isomerase [bacterium]|nr:phosphoribosylanthranilate isomerase [bacterium]